jgi:hypothetical protein
LRRSPAIGQNLKRAATAWAGSSLGCDYLSRLAAVLDAQVFLSRKKK